MGYQRRVHGAQFVDKSSLGRSLDLSFQTPCTCHPPCCSLLCFAWSLFVLQHLSPRWTVTQSTFMLSTASMATQSTGDESLNQSKGAKSLTQSTGAKSLTQSTGAKCLSL